MFFKYRIREQSKKQRKNRAEVTEEESSDDSVDDEIHQLAASLGSKWRLHDVPSDGNCLFHALSHQMRANNLGHYSHQVLRERVTDYMLEHKDEFQLFICSGSVESYAAKMRTSSVFGGELEINAFCAMLKCRVNVWTAHGVLEYGQEHAKASNDPVINIVFLREQYSSPHYMSVTSKVDSL